MRPSLEKGCVCEQIFTLIIRFLKNKKRVCEQKSSENLFVYVFANNFKLILKFCFSRTASYFENVYTNGFFNKIFYLRYYSQNLHPESFFLMWSVTSYVTRKFEIVSQLIVGLVWIFYSYYLYNNLRSITSSKNLSYRTEPKLGSNSGIWDCQPHVINMHANAMVGLCCKYKIRENKNHI